MRLPKRYPQSCILKKENITDDWGILARDIKNRLRDTKDPIPYFLLLLDEADRFIESSEAVNYQPFDALAAVLAALESVDLVVVFTDKVPLKVIEKARPDIYVKGGDYRVEDLPEAKLVAGWGAKTVTVTFDYQRSTTALLKKVRSS